MIIEYINIKIYHLWCHKAILFIMDYIIQSLGARQDYPMLASILIYVYFLKIFGHSVESILFYILLCISVENTNVPTAQSL